MNNELINNDNEINSIFDNIKDLVINSKLVALFRINYGILIIIKTKLEKKIL